MELPKPEQFTYGWGGILCPAPACPWSWDIEFGDRTLASMLAAAQSHIDEVHDRCGAKGDFGAVGALEAYVCNRKVHNDIRHNWVLVRQDEAR
jgi:hypothetical protein